MNLSLLSFLFIFINLSIASGQLLEGIYCGEQNCYEVLNITREATRSEISKAYRLLAKKFHPDLHRGAAAKADAEESFKKIANAYEILKDEESRNDYNYMLDNPQEYYAHYYRYYRRRVSPKVDVRLVLIVSISIISIIQYYCAWQRYDDAIKYFLTVPKYRHKAMEIIQQKEVKNSQNKKAKNKLSKSEQKEENEKLIREIILENMDIKGAYAKPHYTDILWMQLILSPVTVTKYFIWYFGWIWNFTIMKNPFGEEEKLYLIRKYLKMGKHQFDGVEEETKREYLDLELWIKANFVEWKAEQEEEMKISLAENTKYKQYRRYMKNHGPGRMTFED